MSNQNLRRGVVRDPFMPGPSMTAVALVQAWLRYIMVPAYFLLALLVSALVVFRDDWSGSAALAIGAWAIFGMTLLLLRFAAELRADQIEHDQWCATRRAVEYDGNW